MPHRYIIHAWVLAFAIILGTVASKAQIPAAKAPDDLKTAIRADHPRLFFNRDTFPAVKARALGPDLADYDRMKARTDKLLAADSLAFDDYGPEASEAAFLWLTTEDDRYLGLARRLLKTSIDFYVDSYRQKKPANWFAFGQIDAWAAYDWIFTRLSPAERRDWGRPFLEQVELIQPTTARRSFLPQENWSGPTTGFYGNRSILWFAGLATIGEDIDEPRSETFLAEGYRLYMEVLTNRRKGAGDDGGSSTTAMNYAMAAYPWSVFNFFHTFRSATGKNIALDWPDASYMPGYLYWNLLPGGREFGVGDAHHTNNAIALGNMQAHILQIIHFYGASEPRGAGFAKWMLSQVPAGNWSEFTWTPFLLTERRDDLDPIPPAAVMPRARHFENMGQVFMRSGPGPEDTYALFQCGGVLEQHKHWDNNHFAIFKKGFLALDTGSRPSGQHTQHYYPRTVAHNCILITMPGEEFPVFIDRGVADAQPWGRPAEGEVESPIPNDGGQRELIGSKVVAFETSDDFSYAAGDATRAYIPEKCRLALRQLVFLNPDYFVVFDRVTSTRPEYKKTWLLHTATEPRIEGDTFTASQEQGRLFSRTLLPERFTMTSIGGPGHQFEVAGRNYPMPKGHAYTDTTQLFGQWRVEVSPSEPNTTDLFLHFLQAGDIGLAASAPSELVRDGTRVGVRFDDKGRMWEVLFDTEGPAGGHVKIMEQGKTVVDRELTRAVQMQMGLFGME